MLTFTPDFITSNCGFNEKERPQGKPDRPKPLRLQQSLYHPLTALHKKVSAYH
jgi:hypothetical protein